jgi:DNA-binding transcriptional MocR family regulator
MLTEPHAPYERIAVELRGAIFDGKYVDGEQLPTIKQLAETYEVASGTAQRAVSLLASWGLVAVSRGLRAVVRVSEHQPTGSDVTGNVALDDGEPAGRSQDDSDGAATTSVPQLWKITLRGPGGHRYPPRHVRADIGQPDLFRAHLLAIARIEAPAETDGNDRWISDYELEVAETAGQKPMLVLRWQDE